jgi:hypothetical protein
MIQFLDFSNLSTFSFGVIFPGKSLKEIKSREYIYTG